MIRTKDRRRPALRVRLECLETRALMSLTATGEPIFGIVGKALMGQVATFTDDDTTLMSGDLTAAINWGDGTTSSGTVASISGTEYAVDGVHTYTNFSTGSGYPVLVLIQDTKNMLSATADTTATISDAPLYAGNPVSPGVSQQFMGVGPVNVAATIGNFRAAIGGADNGSTPSPQASGSRTINWDDVATDGTDDGGPPNTTVIAQGTTVAIPQTRYEAEGAYFNSPLAVSNNGFATVDPNAATLFPAYSGTNTAAPFNDNTIGLTFVAPGASGTTPSAAATKGFGGVFLNVEQANTTTIQYFDGARSLGQFSVPTGTVGQPEFLGELFTNPVITRVLITLGTDALFSFNGVTYTAGTTTDDPAIDQNLVAADDFVYAEPVPIANAGTILDGAAGTSTAAAIPAMAGTGFTGTVASFSSDNPGASPKNFTATINYGDGHLGQGTITLNSQGGFDVTGTNTFASPGTYPVTTTITSFGGSTVTVNNTVDATPVGTSVVVTSSANPARASQPVTLLASVYLASSSTTTPSGSVTFYDGLNPLATVPLSLGNTATLSTVFTGGSHAITAQYSGDSGFGGSTSAVVNQVVNPDVTSLFGIYLGGFKIQRGFVQKVTVKNNSNVAITGPIDLVLDNLASGVTLKNAAGTVVSTAPVGSPYVVLPLGTSASLAAGQTTSINLVFAARRPRLISYTPRILAGLDQP